MKRQAYCAKEELLDLLKLGVFASEAEAMADKTKDKEWHKRLKTIETLSMKIFDERLECLDPLQKQTVLRRYKHTSIKFYTSDQDRLRKNEDNKPESSFNICHSDFFDVLDLAMMNCMCCPQGECIKECYYRTLYHRLGVPVSRDNPAEGQCEFGYDTFVEPKHHLLKIKEERERI